MFYKYMNNLLDIAFILVYDLRKLIDKDNEDEY